MFGIKGKDSTKEMKEFEHLRQAWRPAERRDQNGADGTANRPANGSTNQETHPMSNITVTVVPATPRVDGANPAEAGDCSSIVSIGSMWQGSLKIDGSVRIDGELSGEIEAEGTVIVSEGAQVDAKVRAAFVVIAGSFQGEVDCSERLDIMPTGRVTAQLTTTSLVVHEGAFLDGQVHMRERQPSVGSSRAELPDREASHPALSLPAEVPAAKPAPAGAA